MPYVCHMYAICMPYVCHVVSSNSSQVCVQPPGSWDQAHWTIEAKPTLARLRSIWDHVSFAFFLFVSYVPELDSSKSFLLLRSLPRTPSRKAGGLHYRPNKRSDCGKLWHGCHNICSSYKSLQPLAILNRCRFIYTCALNLVEAINKHKRFAWCAEMLRKNKMLQSQSKRLKCWCLWRSVPKTKWIHSLQIPTFLHSESFSKIMWTCPQVSLETPWGMTGMEPRPDLSWPEWPDSHVSAVALEVCCVQLTASAHFRRQGRSAGRSLECCLACVLHRINFVSMMIKSNFNTYIFNTHTHMLRMVIANCEVECILRAKNSSVTWKDWTRCLTNNSCSFWMLVEMVWIAKTVR